MPTRPTRALIVLACLAPAALTAACSVLPSSSGPAPEGSTLAAPYTVDHDAWRTVGYRWDWTSRPPLTKRGQIAFADAYPDVVVVQDTNAMVSVIEANTGKVRWNKQVGNTATRFLGNTRKDDHVVITNETELFEIDLANGNTVDRTSLNTIVSTAPALFGDIAVLGTPAGRLMGFDTRNNLRVWEYQFEGSFETQPLALSDNQVAAISTKGQWRALRVDDASTISTGQISGDSSDHLVSDGYFLYIASVDQSVYAYDLADGARMWRARSSAPVTVQPVLIGEHLYYTTRDDGLTCVIGETGEKVWSNPDIGGWVVTTLGNDLMVWTGRELIQVDSERGDVIARTTIPDLAGLRSDSPTDGRIYAISRDGAVARFSPR